MTARPVTGPLARVANKWKLPRLGIICASAAIAALILTSGSGFGLAGSTPSKGAIRTVLLTGEHGCAATTATRPWFSLANVKGAVGVGIANSTKCTNFAGLIGPSTASARSELVVALRINIPAGLHNVTATVAMKVHDSGQIVLPAPCPTKPFRSVSHYTPSVWVNYSGRSGYCAASAQSDVFEIIYLFDLTNKSLLPLAQSTGCQTSLAPICEVSQSNQSQNVNDTYYGVQHNATWNGKHWLRSQFSFNANTSAVTSQPRWFIALNFTRTVSWVYHFVAKHLYALVCDFGAFAAVGITAWPHSVVSANYDGGAHGNGVSIPSVTIT